MTHTIHFLSYICSVVSFTAHNRQRGASAPVHTYYLGHASSTCALILDEISLIRSSLWKFFTLGVKHTPAFASENNVAAFANAESTSVEGYQELQILSTIEYLFGKQSLFDQSCFRGVNPCCGTYIGIVCSALAIFVAPKFPLVTHIFHQGAHLLILATILSLWHPLSHCGTYLRIWLTPWHQHLSWLCSTYVLFVTYIL